MKATLKALVTSAIAFGMMFLLMFTTPTTARADESEEQQQEQTETKEKSDDMKKMINDFIALLKEKYGANYESEYNKIIEEWGDVESYLLGLADSEIVPDVAKDGFTKFVQGMGEYAPIWATFLAIVFAVIFAVKEVRKQRKIDGLAGKVRKLIEGQNALTEGQIASLSASRKLLGTNGKCEEERQRIDEAQETLKRDI